MTIDTGRIRSGALSAGRRTGVILKFVPSPLGGQRVVGKLRGDRDDLGTYLLQPRQHALEAPKALMTIASEGHCSRSACPLASHALVGIRCCCWLRPVPRGSISEIVEFGKERSRRRNIRV